MAPAAVAPNVAHTAVKQHVDTPTVTVRANAPSQSPNPDDIGLESLLSFPVVPGPALDSPAPADPPPADMHVARRRRRRYDDTQLPSRSAAGDSETGDAKASWCRDRVIVEDGGMGLRCYVDVEVQRYGIWGEGGKS